LSFPASEKIQIPSDSVVKSQDLDIAEVILALIRQPNVVSTLWRNRQSRREQLSTSEAHKARHGFFYIYAE
jgi:hypothetical protein